MNIYHIAWTWNGYGLNSVVIASDETEAVRTLDLDPLHTGDTCVYLIGTCTDGTTTSRIVCEESL